MKPILFVLAVFVLLAGITSAQSSTDSLATYQSIVDKHRTYKAALVYLDYITTNKDSIKLFINLPDQTFYMALKTTLAQRDIITPVRAEIRDSITAIKLRINTYWP